MIFAQYEGRKHTLTIVTKYAYQLIILYKNAFVA